jgi:hypothetical protein
VAALNQIVVDCRDPAALARFWARLLDGTVLDRERGWSQVDAPGFPRLAFQPVPEPKAAKNRLHLDITVPPGRVADAAATAIGLGARAVGVEVRDEKGSFQVMRDPEGTEFCLVGG